MRLAAALLAAPVALALAFAPARAARAQCGATVSTCRQCHEVRGERAVLHDGRAWHADHAFGDFCAECHGGDPRAENVVASHAELTDPLAPGGARCVACHTSDAPDLAARYAEARAAAAHASSVANAVPEARPARHDTALSVVVAAIGCASSLFVIVNERRRRAVGRGRP